MLKKISPEEKSVLELYHMGWSFEEMISMMEVTRTEDTSILIDNNIKLIRKVQSEIEHIQKTSKNK